MQDPLAPLIASLHAQGRLRVWSLVITAFGDLVQHRGGEISLARLGRLLGRIGVEQGALRTALSRLARDGWVLSTRRGRASFYRLSAQGTDRFGPATSRIYAPPAATGVTLWSLALRLDTPGATLRPADAAPLPGDLRLTGRIEHISEAYRAALLSDSYRAALAGLAADLAAMNGELADPLDAAAARLLLIHRWRRIVLRYDEIPPDLMPADAPLADPRRAVAAAYRRRAPAAESWLDSTDGDLAAMPAGDTRFAGRFGGPQHA